MRNGRDTVLSACRFGICCPPVTDGQDHVTTQREEYMQASQTMVAGIQETTTHEVP
ncbi:hypothetical protein SXCC_03801 [Gluconacetobacter sp. SXCC-1]|nr:hypothetical protein SXCC_03801 [Gluconacetobacter sp. SXCC-1]